MPAWNIEVTDLTRISDAVSVCIGLVRIAHRRTIVDTVQYSVPIRVAIGCPAATHSGIDLIGISWTVVTSISCPVSIRIFLVVWN
jgi:hypothetical protein